MSNNKNDNGLLISLFKNISNINSSLTELLNNLIEIKAKLDDINKINYDHMIQVTKDHENCKNKTFIDDFLNNNRLNNILSSIESFYKWFIVFKWIVLTILTLLIGGVLKWIFENVKFEI